MFVSLDITVTGTIVANGGGGGGKTDIANGCNSGAGGSGAGGMVCLSAETVAVSGTITSNGGAIPALPAEFGLINSGGVGSDGRIQLTYSDTLDTAGSTIDPEAATSVIASPCE